MKFPRLMRLLPNWKNAALAVISAILLILAFPDFGFWFLAWFGLAPLFWAIVRESESSVRSFFLGWLWGIVFFTGTCWWLTFAPITYAGFPTPLAYFLLLLVTGGVGLFPAIFAALAAFFVRRGFPTVVFPLTWVISEFLRYWLTGNNWNALGYSQALDGWGISYASVGGVYLVSFFIALINAALVAIAEDFGHRLFHNALMVHRGEQPELEEAPREPGKWSFLQPLGVALVVVIALRFFDSQIPDHRVGANPNDEVRVVAIQPNVPMSGLTDDKWKQLRQRHVQLAEAALNELTTDHRPPTTVVFPESPMNFMWQEDMEFQKYIRAFAAKNNAQVLFNSAEPDGNEHNYFNSAVLVGTDGRELAQYDKIYLLPFGESVPAPLQAIVPAFVGSFSYGKEYDLLPLGDVKAGVMICFESHFGELGREYVKNGADVIIEMTNDGYLGPTPVLKQHLANAVFRAVETNRPVLRVTNVGITAYINERGEVSDTADSYTEATRVWSVAKSDGSQTFYVRYGDWFAWLCTIVTIAMLGWAIVRRRTSQLTSDN